MTFQSPGDILFSIGGFPIYYYGAVMAIACSTGVFVSYKVFQYFNRDKNFEKIWDFAAYLLIAGFLGARLYYCLLSPAYYLQHPLAIFNFREGGLSIHGGLIAGAAALIFLSKRYKLPVLNTLDAFSCGAAIAQSIGRWGNFFNSEAFGSPANIPWKLYIPLSRRPEQFIDYNYFHPAFLYESILDICIFIILLFVIKKSAQKFPGLTCFVYLVLYSFARLLVETFRVDSALDICGMPIAKIMSFVLIVTGIAGIVTIIKKNCSKI